MHDRPSNSPGLRLRLLRMAGLAGLLSATLVLSAACTRQPADVAAIGVPAGDAVQASTPRPVQPGPARDAEVANVVPQAPVIDETAPPPPKLSGLALADATAAAEPMRVTRPATSIAPPVPVAGGKLDDRCASDTDCAIKDVGSCCGYRPQCLNRDSPTDAGAVKARCASEGRVGICGFPAIAGCQCVQGHCAASLQTDEARVQ